MSCAIGESWASFDRKKQRKRAALGTPDRRRWLGSVSGMIVGLPGTRVNEKGKRTRISVTGASHTSLTKLAGIQLDCYASGVSLLGGTAARRGQKP